jgi:cytochrome c oxidase subunit 1/cytochrome c oxidase subunit I+III
MHISGLLGMPRRIYTYPEGMGWDTVNMVTSIGSFVFALGILVFLFNVARSLKVGQPSGSNPWDAASLEWSVPSPPPPYNFAVIPVIASRHPLWESRLGTQSARSSLDAGYLLDHGRETMGTSPIHATPDLILRMPEDSYAPFWLGLFLFLMFSALVLRMWFGAGLMAVGCAFALLAWLWPEARLGERAPQSASESHHE